MKTFKAETFADGNKRFSKQSTFNRIPSKATNRYVLASGYFLILLAIVVGIATRLFAVFQYVTFDVGPDPDQIRDAFAVINMWQGAFPTLGPQVSTLGRHHILPLYYYLFFPFTVLGADPVFQALPNALFSFLSIPLFICLTHQLLENVKKSTRFFLSGLGGLWYSVLFGDIFINNFQWNPSSIPFFIMVLTLLYKLQMQGRGSFFVQTLLWTFSGVILAVLVSLHSSTLFIMPIVFAITSLFFIYKVISQRRNPLLITLPILAVLSAVVTLLPYWIGEIGRSFQNTKAILKTVLRSSNESGDYFLVALYTKVSNLFLSYFTLSQQTYFWNASLFCLLASIIFLSLVSWWGIVKFRGNQYIWLMWCSIWVIYLLAAANINPMETPIHYRLPVLFTPIVVTLSSLAYLDCSSDKKKLFSAAVGLFVIYSIFINSLHDYQFMLSKYGANRLMNTSDITQIMEQLPAGSTICDPRIKRKREVNNQYNYIDTYITRKGITALADCQKDSFVIHPKRVMLMENSFLNRGNYQDTYFVRVIPKPTIDLFPTFKVVDNEVIETPHTLFLETDVAYVYRLS